jgi:hypothetical protein
MISKSRLSWWTRVEQSSQITRKVVRVRTVVKYEFELNKLHINEFGADLFMRQTHSDVFHFHEVSLERIVEPVFEGNELGYLGEAISRS